MLWNKYKDKIRAAHQDEPPVWRKSTPLDERTERLILALVFAAKSDGHIDAKERAAIDQQLREPVWKIKGRVLIEQAIETTAGSTTRLPGSAMKKRRWKSIS